MKSACQLEYFMLLYWQVSCHYFFSPDPKKRSVVGIISLALIALMFLIDIHIEDLNSRHFVVQKIMADSVNTLINIRPNNSTWFEFRDESFAKQIETARQGAGYRKLQMIFNPNFEQVVYSFLFYLLFN